MNIEIMTMPTMIQTNPKRRPGTDLGVLSPYLRTMGIKEVYLEQVLRRLKLQVAHLRFWNLSTRPPLLRHGDNLSW